MIIDKQHIISKFRWDTRINDEKKAFELQDQLISWTKKSIKPEIGSLFDQICPEDQYWRIDSLELDLGIIELGDLQGELIWKIPKILRSELERQIIIRETVQGKISVGGQSSSYLGILEYFLLHGYLPWYYNPKNSSINQLLAYLLNNSKEELLLLLNDIAENRQARQRMASQFSETNLTEILKSILPYNYQKILQFHKEFTHLQWDETSRQTGNHRVRENLWFTTLNRILCDFRSVLSLNSFIEQTLLDMASNSGMGQDEYLRGVKKQSVKLKGNSVIKSYLANHARPVADVTERELDQNWIYLEQFIGGRKSWPGGLKKDDPNRVLLTLSRIDSTKFSELIANLEYPEAHWQQVSQTLDPMVLDAIIEARPSRSSRSVIRTINLLDNFLNTKDAEKFRKLIRARSLALLFEPKDVELKSSTILQHLLLTSSVKNDPLPKIILDKAVYSPPASLSGTTPNSQGFGELKKVLTELPSPNNPSFYSKQIKILIDSLYEQAQDLLHDRSSFYSSHLSLIDYILFSPTHAFDVLRKSREKKDVDKLLSTFLDPYTSALLLEAAHPEYYSKIKSIEDFVKELLASPRTSETIKLEKDVSLMHFALRLLMERPDIEITAFSESILHYLLKKLRCLSGHELLLELMDRLRHSEMLKNLGISPTSRSKIRKYTLEGKGLNGLGAITDFINSAFGSEYEVSKLLRIVLNTTAITVKDLFETENGKTILNYLVADACSTAGTLIDTYCNLLIPQISDISKDEIREEIQKIAVLSFTDFPRHLGSKRAFKKVFEEALFYKFPIVQGKNSSPTKQDEIIQKHERKIPLNPGLTITETQLFELVHRSLKSNLKTVRFENSKIEVAALLVAGLETSPDKFITVLNRVDNSEKTIDTLKRAFSFEKF